MSKFSLFGGSEPRRVELVPASETEASKRKARAAFWVCTVAGAVIGSGVMYGRMHPIYAAIAGGVAGAILGLVVGAVIRVWWIVRAVWHWLAEIVTALALWTALVTVANAVGPVAAVLGFAVLAAGVASWPPSRRVTRDVLWCAITRHRVRKTLNRFVAPPRFGAAHHPWILAARPTPAGVRVWVWMRLGLTLLDLNDRVRAELAGTALAADARVTPASTRFASLIRVDVTHRDPLARTVTAPLAGQIPDFPRPRSAAIEGDVLGLSLDDIPDVPAAPPSGRGRTASRS